MKLTIIESPYAGDVEFNTEYARRCMFDSLNRGEAPFASHLLYTQVLDDNAERERGLGIEAGLAWAVVAERHVFYLDLGWSRGMTLAAAWCKQVGRSIMLRTLYKQRSLIPFSFGDDNGLASWVEKMPYDAA